MGRGEHSDSNVYNNTILDLELNEKLLHGLENIGWEFATQVQKGSFRLHRAERMLLDRLELVQKTAAFGLPTMNACH